MLRYGHPPNLADNILAIQSSYETVTFQIQQKKSSKLGMLRYGHPHDMAENILAKYVPYEMGVLNLAEYILAKQASHKVITLTTQQKIFQQNVCLTKTVTDNFIAHSISICGKFQCGQLYIKGDKESQISSTPSRPIVSKNQQYIL